MKYTIKFNYMDGELFEIDVPSHKMEALISAINSGDVYFDEVTGAGIWISIDKVRYFHVERVDANGNRVVSNDEKEEDSPKWNEIE